MNPTGLLVMAENENDCIKSEHEAKAADKASDVCFFCWLRTSCKYAGEQAEKYNYEYDKYRDAPCPIRDWPAKITANHRLLLASVLVAATAFFLTLFKFGAFNDSNRSMATFTAILIAVGVVQWWTTRRQWQAMREANAEFTSQNAIMAEQVKQTDEMIKQMRLDNRAWLSIVDVKIKRLAKGGYNKVIPSLFVKNSGKTPGRIIEGAIWFYVCEKNQATELIIYDFESKPLDHRKAYVVHPNEPICLEMDSLGELHDNVIENIRIGDYNLHVLARLRYRFIGGATDIEKAFFTSISAGPDMRRQPNYCAVHKEIGVGQDLNHSSPPSLE
jgi:hypothetical protein